MLNFEEGGKTGWPGTRTNNKLNPHKTPGPGITLGPRWWEANADTSAPSLAFQEIAKHSYRKLSIISPGLIFVWKGFFGGHIFVSWKGGGKSLLLEEALGFENGLASFWKGFCTWNEGFCVLKRCAITNMQARSKAEITGGLANWPSPSPPTPPVKIQAWTNRS